jgi:hypothetical protein
VLSANSELLSSLHVRRGADRPGQDGLAPTLGQQRGRGHLLSDAERALLAEWLDRIAAG